MLVIHIKRGLILIKPNWLKEFSGAWIFYTILPKWPYIKPSFKRIARFAPLIGLILGFFQALILLSLSKLGWSANSLPFFAIAINLWVTGGLHYDGLMDTADGVAAGPNRYLEAMKDSRVGASGVIALIINIFVQLAALLKLNSYYFFVLPTAYFWGRYSQILAIGNYSYLNNNGNSEFHKLNWNGNLKESIPSIICMISGLYFILKLDILSSLKIYFIISNVLALIISIIIPKLLAKRLGGHCGDSYGASVVLVETCTLFLISIILPA